MKLIHKSLRLTECFHKAKMGHLISQIIDLPDELIDRHLQEIERRHPEWTPHEQQERAVLRAVAQMDIRLVVHKEPLVPKSTGYPIWMELLWKIGVILLLAAQLL